MSLAMTSDYDEDELQEFDFCFENNGDTKWYKNPDLTQDERNLKAFPGSMLGEESSSELLKDIKFHLIMLATTAVKMLNCNDHCLASFFL